MERSSTNETTNKVIDEIKNENARTISEIRAENTRVLEEIRADRAREREEHARELEEIRVAHVRERKEWDEQKNFLLDQIRIINETNIDSATKRNAKY